MPHLRTEHLTLYIGAYHRSFHPEAHIRWLNNKELMKYSEQRHHTHTLQSQRKYLASFDHVHSFFWEITPHDMQYPLGSATAYCDWQNKTADIGILIAAFQQRGYGTEAWQAVCDWDALGVHHDPVAQLVGEGGLITKHSKVLEIGCSNGWRLRTLKDKYGCQVYGVEPSKDAIVEAKTKFDLIIQQGIASDLPYSWEDLFDVVIMGFCMWLIEPRDWFLTVAESDRVLKDGGALVIHDYCYPRPFRQPYNFDAEAVSHRDAYCFFFDWPKLWLVNPGYQMRGESVDTKSHQSISVLRKNMNFLNV